MSGVKMKYSPKFQISSRIEKLQKRSRELAISGKRNLYTANETQLVYHWSDAGNAIAPRSGDGEFHGLSLGDHGCRVDIGIPFPLLDQMPSKIKGYEATPESWGEDFNFLLKHSPAEIYPNESIVGEFHWEMNEVRKYDFGEHIKELGKKARALGAGGNSHGHMCSELSIGLSQGWGGILKRINKSLEKYEKLENKNKVCYLKGAKFTCEAIIDYIKKYSEKAKQLSESEDNAEQKQLYAKIGNACGNIAENPPKTFYEAVQFENDDMLRLHFADSIGYEIENNVFVSNNDLRVNIALATFENEVTAEMIKERLMFIHYRMNNNCFCTPTSNIVVNE